MWERRISYLVKVHVHFRQHACTCYTVTFSYREMTVPNHYRMWYDDAWLRRSRGVKFTCSLKSAKNAPGTHLSAALARHQCPPMRPHWPPHTYASIRQRAIAIRPGSGQGETCFWGGSEVGSGSVSGELF